MRIHGEIRIRRRIYQEEIAQENARDMLKEDFGDLCGYCGKNRRFFHEHFHVDHFVPQSVDAGRIRDYANFAWACPKCNLIKSNKWPTKDKAAPYRDDIGFVDPAGGEFDKHLFRDKTGHIRGSTALGEQMCLLLNFHLRKTELFWKVEKLCLQMEQMEQKHQSGLLQPEEYGFYIDMNIMLRKILEELLDKRE